MIVKAWLLPIKLTNHKKWYSSLRLLKTGDTCILQCFEGTFLQLYQRILRQKGEQNIDCFVEEE